MFEYQNYNFRIANASDIAEIWQILQQAIIRRKNDESQQWQQGYPNLETVQDDISQNFGYVLELDKKIAGYAAVLFQEDPFYKNIEGKWLTDSHYVVVHRVAVADAFMGQGIAIGIFKNIEMLAQALKTPSIRVDTNFDNAPMLHILKKIGYQFCGEVQVQGNARMAFEKILSTDESTTETHVHS